MTAHELLSNIHEDAACLYRILEREAPEFAWYWANVTETVTRLLSLAPASLPLAEAEEIANGIPRALGVGMGSLSDLVLQRDDRAEMRRANDELRQLRRRLSLNAEKLVEALREARPDVRHLRRYVTELEDALLRCNRHELVARCRSLLCAEVVDSTVTRELVDHILRWPDYLLPAQHVIGPPATALATQLARVFVAQEQAS